MSSCNVYENGMNQKAEVGQQNKQWQNLLLAGWVQELFQLPEQTT